MRRKVFMRPPYTRHFTARRIPPGIRWLLLALLGAGGVTPAAGGSEQSDVVSNYFRLAEITLNEGDIEGAIKVYDRMIFQAPLNAPAMARACYNRALLKNRLGRTDEAIEDYTRSIEAEGTFVQSLCNRGNLYAARREDARAIRDYARANEVDPSFAPAYFCRGFLYHRTGQRELAMRDYQKAIELDPSLGEGFCGRGMLRDEQGDLEGARADLRIAVSLSPELALARAAYGNVLRRLGELDAALVELNEAIRLDPGLSDAYHARALVLSRKGQPDGAVGDMNRALAIAPDYAPFHRSRGIAGLRAGESLWSVVSNQTAALEKDPDLISARLSRGRAWRELGRLDEALEDFDVAVSRAPAEPEGYAERALVRQRQGLFNDAEQDLETALRLAPERADFRNNLGALLLNGGRTKEAIPHLERALEIEPSLFEAAYNLAKALKEQGQLSRALEMFDRAYNADPAKSETPDFYWRRGQAHFGSSRYEKALSDFDQALALDARRPELHESRAITLEAMGLPQEAAAARSMAAELRLP